MKSAEAHDRPGHDRRRGESSACKQSRRHRWSSKHGSVSVFIVLLVLASILVGRVAAEPQDTTPARRKHDKVQILDERHVPHPGHRHKRRLVFIGDIHGCSREFNRLLTELHFDHQRDHLVHTGDVLAKGPDSAAVIDTLISLGASGVRGNWEDKVLYAARSSNSPKASNDTGFPLGHLWMPWMGKSSDRAASTLASLKPHHLRYLRSLPLILRIPPLSSLTSRPETSSVENDMSGDGSQDTSLSTFMRHETLPNLQPPVEIQVVHAGLVPTIPLSKQDPSAVMNMRSLNPDTLRPSPDRTAGRQWPWFAVWNVYQRRLNGTSTHTDCRGPNSWPAICGTGSAGMDEAPSAIGWWAWAERFAQQFLADVQESEWGGLGEEGFGVKDARTETDVDDDQLHRQKPSMVVYGHNSRDGVRVEDWTVGLDGGCVRGGRLTAMTLDAWGRRKLYSVKCENYLD